MKKIFAITFIFCSVSSFADTFCEYRFNDQLAVMITIDNHMALPESGTIQWDDVNQCGYDVETGERTCTELGIYGHALEFRDLSPEAEGEVTFAVTAAAQDENGNPLKPALERFTKSITFRSTVLPEPQVTFNLGGIDHQMTCEIE